MKHFYLILTFVAAFAAVPAACPAQNPDYSAYILTPKAPATPRINGARVYGQSPDVDFLFKIPASGERPMTFSAEGLPKGLKLDSRTGIITGRVRKEGSYIVTLTATNRLGSDSKPLRLEIGEDRLLLTPPMGWSSWNCFGNTVSQEHAMAMAKAFVDLGLDQYGWSYINLDDGWQYDRGGKHNAIMPNSKFPDMMGLSDYIHSLGLKFGIYSGPWTGTYAGHIGESSDNPEGRAWWVEQGVCELI
ncbi:MAG: putative Ig domain-containing protein, partial [Candidatus Cryptobacteroides sp.]